MTTLKERADIEERMNGVNLKSGHRYLVVISTPSASYERFWFVSFPAALHFASNYKHKKRLLEFSMHRNEKLVCYLHGATESYIERTLGK